MDPVPFGHAYRASATGVAPPHITAMRDALPRWRVRIFWSFQVVFWLAIGAAVLGMSTALKPEEPMPWLPVALRVITGFVVSSLVYLLFETPRVQSLPRKVRWPLMVGVAVVALAASILLLIGGVVGGPTNWTRETTLGPLVPRLIAAGLWCLIVFGL